MAFSPLPRKIQAGLVLLREASEYAKDLSCDPWDFAVEIACLRAVGLNNSDLRWLVRKGYVRHAEETTVAGQHKRRFRPCGELTFTARTCFVPTESGVQVGRRSSPSTVVEPLPVSGARMRIVHGVHAIARPHWDPTKRELRVGGVLVKRFRVPAPNQELVLSAFEEERWPPRIDDPLPPNGEVSPKQRLRTTIHCLNRNMKRPVIRFQGDGTGKGICWEPVRVNRSKPARQRPAR